METEIKPEIKIAKEVYEGNDLIVFYVITCPGLVPEPKAFTNSFRIKNASTKTKGDLAAEIEELKKVALAGWGKSDFNADWSDIPT